MSPAMHGVMRAVLRAWSSWASRSTPVPRPADHPRVTARGPDPDRLLVFGAGAAVGWGVLSHEIALPGALARALAARTQRGADVEVVADPDLTARTAGAALDRVDVSAYTAFVVSLGVNDSLGLVPVEQWRRSLLALVDSVRAGAGSRSRIFLLGIPPIRSVAIYDSVLGGVADRHARQLDQAALELCGITPGLTFVPLTAEPRSHGRFRNRDGYARWGEAIADRIAPIVDLDRAARCNDRSGATSPSASPDRA